MTIAELVPFWVLIGTCVSVSVSSLTSAGPFDDVASVSLDELSLERGEQLANVLDHHLLPIDAPAQLLPSIQIVEAAAFYFRQGQSIMHTEVYRFGAEGDMVRVLSDNDDFLGVGEITGDGKVAPRRLVNTAQSGS